MSGYPFNYASLLCLISWWPFMQACRLRLRITVGFPSPIMALLVLVYHRRLLPYFSTIYCFHAQTKKYPLHRKCALSTKLKGWRFMSLKCLGRSCIALPLLRLEEHSKDAPLKSAGLLYMDWRVITWVSKKWQGQEFLPYYMQEQVHDDNKITLFVFSFGLQ